MESLPPALTGSEQPREYAFELLQKALRVLDIEKPYLTDLPVLRVFEIAEKRNISLQEAAKVLAISMKSREYVDMYLD